MRAVGRDPKRASALGDEARPVTEVAGELECDQEALQRLLRALVVVGLTEETNPGVYRLTDVGRYFRADVEDSVRPYALMAGSPALLDTLPLEIWLSTVAVSEES